MTHKNLQFKKTTIFRLRFNNADGFSRRKTLIIVHFRLENILSSSDDNNFVYENFVPSFANDSHQSSQTEEHKNLIADCADLISKSK